MQLALRHLVARSSGKVENVDDVSTIDSIEAAMLEMVDEGLLLMSVNEHGDLIFWPVV